MTAREFLLTEWHFEPSIVAGCAALLVAYWLAHRRDLSRAAWFVAGVGVIALALLSPLDPLADEYLLSAHMVQHMLLVLVAPPLLLLGVTAADVDAMFGVHAIAAAQRMLGNPLVAWTVGAATLFIWHAPVLYDAALRAQWLHIFEHVSFLATGVIFWWPVVVRLPTPRLSAPGALLYLAAGALAGSVLGILITFARPGAYTAYLNPPDTRGMLALLRDEWGITPQFDQRLGGLLMWTAGAPVFLLAMLAVLARWYREPERDASCKSAVAGVATQ
ncbi:MAG: cytochrome c oxidase assembly protein [Candidatus Binataceae bacterium]